MSILQIIKDKENTIIKNVKDFSIEQTLECGQCFNFEKISEMEYVVIARGRMLHIRQEKHDLLLYGTKQKEEVQLWIDYFDLERDYSKIKSYLAREDSSLQEAMKEKSGIRILNQEFYETLLSFIISQSKNISHIKQIVQTLSRRFGTPLGELNKKTYFSFPSVDILRGLTEEDFRECKTGFRAPYLVDAVLKLREGNLIEEQLRTFSVEEAGERLMSIRGVGIKVASCVLLYGLGHREAFPVDVWIKRIMEALYFKKEVPAKEIYSFAAERFGEYGGYAQQYLFYYGREHKIGKITRK